jgi:hypothetical protein
VAEFDRWASGLDDEWSNEWSQAGHSVCIPARDRAIEIREEGCR